MVKLYRKLVTMKNSAGETSTTLVDTRQAAFLEAYAQFGTISTASKQAGIDRSSVTRWLANDAEFNAAYLEANRAFGDVIREAIQERAVTGRKRAVIYKGKPVLDQAGQQVYDVVYSDALLIMMARAHLPEYKSSNQDERPVSGENSLIIPDLRKLSQPVLEALIQDLERIQSEEQRTVEADIL